MSIKNIPRTSTSYIIYSTLNTGNNNNNNNSSYHYNYKYFLIIIT